MEEKVKNKPILIIFCGKSASGKSSIVRYLLEHIPNSQQVKADTTRPKRGSKDKEYTFISKKAYLEREKANQYILSNKFRDWYYGFPIKAFQENKINLCIATPKDLAKLAKTFASWNIYVIYLDVPADVRLKRSAARRGHLCFEHIRRLFSDYFDFKNIDKILSSNFKKENIFSPLQYKEKTLFLSAYEIFHFIQGKIIE